MDNLISKQAAIDAVKHAWAKGLEPSQYIEILPPAQQWHTEPPEKSGFYIACSDFGVVGECVYMDNGEWDTDRNYRFPMWCQIVAWMPMPKPYKGEV